MIPANHPNSYCKRRSGQELYRNLWETRWGPRWEPGWKPSWKPEWEPKWEPEWKPGWELEWESEWEAGWEPEWEPGSAREWEPNCDQTGTKLAPNEGPLETDWGSIGASLELHADPWGTPGRSGTSPAPGIPKVPKVCNCRQKQAQGQTGRHAAVPDFRSP